MYGKDYPFLNNAYSLEISGGIGIGNSYLISGLSTETIIDFDGKVLPNLNLDSEFILLETIGLYLTNRTVYKISDNILENNLAFGLTLRPLFAIRLLNNYFTSDYYKEFFYNSISFHLGGVLRYLTFSSRDDAINLLGTQLGTSFNILLSYDRSKELFLKFGYTYSFIENTVLNSKHYNMNGFYYFIAIGLNFRFGDSIDWLTGTDPNTPIIINYK
jgi:hypothetical protein